MSELLEIYARRTNGTEVTLHVPRPFDLEGLQLDVAMQICNQHFGDPDKAIGGPKLPPSR